MTLSDAAWIVTPSGYQNVATSTFTSSDEPWTACARACADGDKMQLVPGYFPRLKGPFGKKRIVCAGWDRERGISTIRADAAVGSTDNIFLGAGDSRWLFNSLNLELDDRAGFKTDNLVGPNLTLVSCFLFGQGSPHDPAWKNDSKWGVHTYGAENYGELDVFKWSIYGEHGYYGHNQKGAQRWSGGGAGYLSGCDILLVNRMNEGCAGVGDVTIEDRETREVCIVQGGSAFTFRGGMPNSTISMKRVKVRLGCDKAIAAPWNQRICGVVSIDQADETAPGKGDGAWPGGTGAFLADQLDFEVGTVYPGVTGQIRPVIQISDCKAVSITNSRIHVTRPAGAYPIAIAIGANVPLFTIGAECDIVGWIQYGDVRYHSLGEFLTAHPECEA